MFQWYEFQKLRLCVFVIFGGIKVIRKGGKNCHPKHPQKHPFFRFLKSLTQNVRISLLVYFISRVYTFNNQKSAFFVPHLFVELPRGSAESGPDKKNTTLRFGCFGGARVFIVDQALEGPFLCHFLCQKCVHTRGLQSFEDSVVKMTQKVTKKWHKKWHKSGKIAWNTRVEGSKSEAHNWFYAKIFPQKWPSQNRSSKKCQKQSLFDLFQDPKKCPKTFEKWPFLKLWRNKNMWKYYKKTH